MYYGTILVVDDNPAILTATKICLSGEFEHIFTLSMPEAVLATLRQERVDVILLGIKRQTLYKNDGAVHDA